MNNFIGKSGLVRSENIRYPPMGQMMIDAHPTMEVWPWQLGIGLWQLGFQLSSTHRDLTNKKWGFTGQEGCWKEYWISLRHLFSCWSPSFWREWLQQQRNQWSKTKSRNKMKTTSDRKGKKKRKKKTKERRKKSETTVQATSQQTPGSSNAWQLWVFCCYIWRSRVGLYTILGDGRHTTMRIHHMSSSHCLTMQLRHHHSDPAIFLPIVFTSLHSFRRWGPMSFVWMFLSHFTLWIPVA